MGFVEKWKQDRRDKAQDRAWEALDAADATRLVEAVRMGASVNAADGEGFTMVHRAVQQQKRALFPLLDQAGGDWCMPLPDGRTVLHLAVESGQSVLVKAVLDRQVDLERSTVMGATALHLAARLGASQIIRMLDHAGCSWAARDKKGSTPLDILGVQHPAQHATWARLQGDRRP